MSNDDLTQLRRRVQARQDGDAGSRPDPTTGPPTMLGKIYNAGAMPGSVPGQFAVRPVSVSGSEAERATPTFTAAANRSEVFTVLGPTVPAVGDVLRGHLVGGRWVAQKQSPPTPPGHSLAGCTCTGLPDTIYMHVASMPPVLETTALPATLVWQTVPASVSGYSLPPAGYFATADSFSSMGSFKGRYFLDCAGGFYVVRFLITPDSPLGYPQQLLVMSWLPGFPGNTCTPFSMTHGSSLNATLLAQGITLNLIGPP